MKYIKLFQEHSGYTEFAASEDFLLHNVSYCKSSEHVHYDPIDYSKEYFTVEALEDGTLYLWYAQDFGESGYLEYSLDNGRNWTRVTNVDGEYNEISTALAVGTKALIRGENVTLGADGEGYSPYRKGGINFGIKNSSNGQIARKQYNVYGNIMSLLYGSNFTDKVTFPSSTAEACFGSFFSQHAVIDAKNLVLPATTLTPQCYECMFELCSGLTVGPNLPATTLAERCYYEMFRNCTSLTTAPELPVTTLVGSCYRSMFSSCTSLTTAPDLPATTLASYCYYEMFRSCTGLTSAPELPATTLAEYCYASMLAWCTNLNYIKCLATDISASGCTTNWLNNVSSTGTFVKNPNMSSWATGANGIPANWTVQDATL